MHASRTIMALAMISASIPNARVVDAAPPAAPTVSERQAPLFDGQWVKDKLALNVEHHYYDWEDDAGNSGRQNVTPLTLTYHQGGFDAGLRGAYIESVNHSPAREGKVATWSDTSLSLAYTLRDLAWPLRFNLDYNAPTGKATLIGAEKNAIMDGSLVWQTRFGEGTNIAPGMSVTHAFGPKDIFGAGASHIRRGAFDPNGDVVNDEIDPGDESIATLQWQHSERNWLVIGGLIYTHSGITQRGGLEYYQKGDRYDLSVIGVLGLPSDQRLQTNLRYSTQSPDHYVDSITSMLAQEERNSNGNSVWLNLDYSKVWAGRHTLHVIADWLKIDANSYDQINNLYNAGRTKYSLGLGYDYAISQKSRISVQAKRFNMKDKATLATGRDTEYEGSNVYLIFNHQF